MSRFIPPTRRQPHRELPPLRNTKSSPPQEVILERAQAVKDYYAARAEHAWLLRAEGLSNKQIEERLGLRQGRAGDVIQCFRVKAYNATAFCKWSWQ